MKKEYVLFLIFPISQVMMILGDYLSMGHSDGVGYLGIGLGVVADVILLYVLIRGSKKEQVEKELEEVRYLKEIENARNDLLEKQHRELQAMRKELECRIRKISEQMENSGKTETVEQELDELQRSLENTRPNAYCQNAVVNAVLAEKEKVCQSLGFSLDAELQVPRTTKVDPLHLCSIFSNLLDNAIEAVEELEEKERRVEIRTEIKGSYLFVKVQNPATQAHAKRRKRKEHGYGTLILEDIAKNYDGTYHAAFENGCYTAAVSVKAV